VSGVPMGGMIGDAETGAGRTGAGAGACAIGVSVTVVKVVSWPTDSAARDETRSGESFMLPCVGISGERSWVLVDNFQR
jgi:hypothetical protein